MVNRVLAKVGEFSQPPDITAMCPRLSGARWRHRHWVGFSVRFTLVQGSSKSFSQAVVIGYSLAFIKTFLPHRKCHSRWFNLGVLILTCKQHFYFPNWFSFLNRNLSSAISNIWGHFTKMWLSNTIFLVSVWNNLDLKCLRFSDMVQILPFPFIDFVRQLDREFEPWQTNSRSVWVAE